MQAKVHTSFKTLLPGEKKNTTIPEGEVLDGHLAQVAVDNGFATPVGAARSQPNPGKAGRKASESQGEGQ